MSALLQTALSLASRGLHVFPCKPRDKRPAVFEGVKRATTDQNTITGWWGANPEFNIGLACGAQSRVFVVDVDGVDAEAELAKLEQQHDALPRTVESLTARGRHIYFAWPDRPVHNSASKIAPGLDVRGQNGYVLAPPSIHPSGKAYCWSVDSTDDFAPAPQWLLAKLAAPTTRDKGANGATPAESWRDLVRDGVGEGQRNDMITRLAGHLLRRYVDPLVALEFLLAWNESRCRPPLAEGEVTMIVDSICSLEMERRGTRRTFGKPKKDAPDDDG